MSVTADLRRFRTFEHFDKATLAVLAACAKRLEVPAGSTVVRQGQDSRELFVLADGALRAVRATNRGRFELARIQVGELVGELGFLSGGARVSDLETATDTALLALESDKLDAAAAADAAFEQALYWSLWKSLSSKLRGANRRLLEFFDEDAQPSSDPGDRLRLPADGPHLDMGAKRGLFEEQRLSSMEIHFLASLSREERYEAGQTIFREGEQGDTMYVVAEGSVVISTVVPGAGDEALAILERGEYFGEMALIDNAPRSADARAHPDAEALVLAIPGDVLEGILDIHNVSSIRLLKLLCRMVGERLRSIDEKLVGWYLMAGGSDRMSAGVATG